MAAPEGDFVNMKVDVGILKTQVSNLTQICAKMDATIEKLVDSHDQMVNQIYNDMDKRKQDTMADIKELHSRITTIDRNLSDKIELTEHRIMDEIKSLRADISEHNKKEESDMKKILEWKWMLAGAVIVIAWILSHVNIPLLGKLLG